MDDNTLQILKTFRIMVVDDFKPWCRFASATIQKEPELQIVGEASDGSEAVEKAQKLQPDLILLDIGLPTLNGIKAATQIHQVAPDAKILFVSQISEAEIVREALSNGAKGYVLKIDAGAELLPAIKAITGGGYFVSGGLKESRC
jgi:DNA-binding NarL/FixJ family response regulator